MLTATTKYKSQASQKTTIHLSSSTRETYHDYSGIRYHGYSDTKHHNYYDIRYASQKHQTQKC